MESNNISNVVIKKVEEKKKEKDHSIIYRALYVIFIIPLFILQISWYVGMTLPISLLLILRDAFAYVKGTDMDDREYERMQRFLYEPFRYLWLLLRRKGKTYGIEDEKAFKLFNI